MSATIVAENVTAFQVDFFPNPAALSNTTLPMGNLTLTTTQWPYPNPSRPTTYAGYMAIVENAIDGVYGVTGATKTTGISPWTRMYAGLFRIAIETRSPTARAQGLASAGRTYVHRTQTLMVYPRNFGVDRVSS
jgi:hypothetical protein